jgi:alkane 1-monooxygenase
MACTGAPVTAWGALVYLTLGTALIDALAPRKALAKPPSQGASLFLGCLHFFVLFASVAAISFASGSPGWGIFFATGLYLGQVSNSAAHELIHSPATIPRSVGRWVYISLLFGHHASAHPKIHHRFVGTPEDPNSARLGESLYKFLPRAWIGSFRRGLSAEEDALRAKGCKGAGLSNPYWTYAFGAVALLLLSYALAGAAGVALHLALFDQPLAFRLT